MRKAVSVVAASAAGLLALTGCGASSGGASAGGASTTPASSAAAPASSAASSAASQSGSAAASGSAGASAAGALQKLTDKSLKIGLDLPETTTARYETKDRPYFTAALKQVCPNCQLLYANANSNASSQQQQAESMLTQGANVLVIDPFDGKAAESIVSAAQAQNVPVIAYDRLIGSPQAGQSPKLAYVVTNDYTQVGKLQGQAFVGALKKEGASTSSGGVLMINGADTDNNAHSIHNGAMSAVGPSGYKVLASVDTWDPDEARTWVANQVTRFGQKIVGIYSANDTNAAAAISALKAAGWNDTQIGKLKLTGLDASVQGLQNIVAGLQYMTTYNAFKLEATKAAEAAVDLAIGKTPQSNGTVAGNPAFLNPPQAVTIDNIKSTVIKDGFWKLSDICTAQYQQACSKAGLQ